MKARQKSNGDYKIVEDGAQIGLIYLLADLGLQASANPAYKPAWQLAVGVQFPTQLNDNGEPLTIIRTMTSSMDPKANLRKFIEELYGKAFPSQEAAGDFDFKNLLGRPGYFNVTHAQKGDKTYANIKSAMPLPKEMAKPDLVGEPLYYSDDLEPVEKSKAYQRLPEWLRKKHDQRLRPVEPGEVAQDAPAAADDDIPF